MLSQAPGPEPLRGERRPVTLAPGNPAILLAPMEGVTDAPMRRYLTALGGYDFVVSEFLRVSQEAPPAHVFRRHVPELAEGSQTESGVPVVVQLLGGDPGRMAEAAARAVLLGAPAIDINFGCPAPTVNRHDGGATLLKFPHRIRAIVAAIRAAVPSSVPVSAKLRLGWDDRNDIDRNAEEAAAGGASWITIHGRTRMDGYRPPADWEPIGRVREALRIPVVANGDLWSLDALRACRDRTGCVHFMLGRSALADPTLPARAGAWLRGEAPGPAPDLGDPGFWHRHFDGFRAVSPRANDDDGRGVVRRAKQWIQLARLHRPVAWFDAVKRAERWDDFARALAELSAASTVRS
jgi:tRNA-dihydrouridine synthase C